MPTRKWFAMFVLFATTTANGCCHNESMTPALTKELGQVSRELQQTRGEIQQLTRKVDELASDHAPPFPWPTVLGFLQVGLLLLLSLLVPTERWKRVLRALAGADFDDEADDERAAELFQRVARMERILSNLVARKTPSKPTVPRLGKRP